MSDESHAPPRLVETLGPAGDCVREALAQREQQSLPSPPRFALLQERRVRRVQRQRGLALVAVVGVLIGVRAWRQQEPLSDIRAELAVNQSNRQPAADASALPIALPNNGELTLSPVKNPERAALASPKAAPRPSRPSPAGVEPNPPSTESAVVPASEPAAPGGAKACAQLARDGASQQALACYARLANGSGMSAELALFEQARLEGKALRRPDRALKTLDDYRQRFPNGTLRGEVMLAQIDWLLASGNSARALEIVEEALASGLLRERTSELERLRATLSAAPRD